LSSLDAVSRRVEEAAKGSISLSAALAACADLESEMIESACFNVIEGDAPELERLLRSLAADTAAHRDRVRQAWERERDAAP
jgi:hypothetical protein